MRNALHFVWPLLLAPLLIACGGTLADGLENPTTLSSNYHGEGWGSQTVAGIHGKVFLSTCTNLPTQPDSKQCANCHGADFTGGTSGVSCSECHAKGPKGEDWTQNCTFCHGGTDDPSGAPPKALDGSTERTSPGVGAHQAHIKASDLHAAFDCGTCHLKPYDIFSLTHLDGKVEVLFPPDGLNAQAGFSRNGCQNTYCHGKGQNSPAFNDPTPLTCHSCHGDAQMPQKLSGAHAIHLHYGVGCDDCHANLKANGATAYQFVDVALHLDGKIQVTLKKGAFDAQNATCTATCHSEERPWFSPLN